MNTEEKDQTLEVDKTEQILEADKKEPHIISREMLQDQVNLFYQAVRRVKSFKVSSNVFRRCFDYAVNKGLTEKKVHLKNDAEKRLAFLMGTVLDCRLIMQAALKQEFDRREKEKNETEKEQEEDGN